MYNRHRWDKRRRKRWKKDGLCTSCGRTREDDNRLRCRRCRTRGNARARESNAKKMATQRHGITVEDKQRLFDSQKGLCCGCLKEIQMQGCAIDHDHQTNMVRGLLCRNCNTALGMAKDNPETLKNLALYLEYSRLVGVR